MVTEITSRDGEKITAESVCIAWWHDYEMPRYGIEYKSLHKLGDVTALNVAWLLDYRDEDADDGTVSYGLNYSCVLVLCEADQPVALVDIGSDSDLPDELSNLPVVDPDDLVTREHNDDDRAAAIDLLPSNPADYSRLYELITPYTSETDDGLILSWDCSSGCVDDVQLAEDDTRTIVAYVNWGDDTLDDRDAARLREALDTAGLEYEICGTGSVWSDDEIEVCLTRETGERLAAVNRVVLAIDNRVADDELPGLVVEILSAIVKKAEENAPV